MISIAPTRVRRPENIMQINLRIGGLIRLRLPDSDCVLEITLEKLGHDYATGKPFVTTVAAVRGRNRQYEFVDPE